MKKTKFVEDVKEQMERDGSYYGIVCCENCAIEAVKYLIENYPNNCTVVKGTENGAFGISSWKSVLGEKE